ncbi:MAG: M48 family metalloprotease [Cyanobacteriota bacterium]
MSERSRLPVSSGSTGAAARALLDAGLAALKRQEYGTAIAHLESLFRTPAERSVQLKARMGLVMAYEKSGNVQEAIALCQTLSNSSHLQTRRWAAKALAEIAQRHPEAAEPAAASAQSLEASPPAAGPAADDDLAAGLTRTSGSRPRSSPPQPARRPISASASPPPGETAIIPVQTAPIDWRLAGRAQKWSPLPMVDRAGLWALGLGTAIALFALLRGLLLLAFWLFNHTLARITFPIDLRYYGIYRDPAAMVLLGLLGLAIALPWLMTALLRWAYQMQPLAIETLEQASPEAARVLKRIFGQQQRPLPKLALLPTDAPLLLTYGSLPRLSHLVVSRGLLAQLQDDEIAALVAGEIGHLQHWTSGVMSLVVLVGLLPHLAYRALGQWGDCQRNSILRTLAMTGSLLCYGIFWLCRAVGLWFSRRRLVYSDRTSANLTGNPNGLSRALLKCSLGLSQAVAQQRHTSPLLESLELLMPVGIKTSLTLGSLYAQHPSPDLFQWDCQNPHRHWLSVSNAHPPLGDRLQHLSRYAQHWRLFSELDLPPATPPRLSWKERRPLLLQAAPYVGLGIGLAIALLLWLIGGVATQFNWRGLIWMWGDRPLLLGCSLLGFSFGTFCRINPFFRDIPRTAPADLSLVDLMQSPAPIPLPGQPLRLRGTLLGQRGICALPSQDLLLQCETGLIRLHHTPRLGPLGSLLSPSRHPSGLIGRPVTVTGWFRRGATPWIDIETIQTTQGATCRSEHPLWSTIVAIAAALWGGYVILTGI